MFELRGIGVLSLSWLAPLACVFLACRHPVIAHLQQSSPFYSDADCLLEFLFFLVPTGVPQMLIVSAASNTSINVSWLPIPLDEQHGVITQYEVLYEQIDSDSTSISLDGNVTTSDGSELFLILSDLDTFRLYAVQVRGFTAVGPGNYTEAMTTRTLTGCKRD